MFNNAIKKAEGNKIHCAWSNEAFELWYLLHFQYRNTPMSRTEYKNQIEISINSHKDYKNKKSFVYKKNDKNIYAILKKYGKQEDAIANAKKLNSLYDSDSFHKHNPCTTVHLLVEELNGNNKDLNTEIDKKHAIQD